MRKKLSVIINNMFCVLCLFGYFLFVWAFWGFVFCFFNFCDVVFWCCCLCVCVCVYVCVCVCVCGGVIVF